MMLYVCEGPPISLEFFVDSSFCFGLPSKVVSVGTLSLPSTLTRTVKWLNSAVAFHTYQNSKMA